MVEREQSSSLKKTLRAHLGVSFRMGMRFFAETPLIIKALKAHKGEIVRKGEVKAQGRIVDYDEGTHIVLTDKGEMVFPNHKAGDIIRPLPHK